jgi:hypothetical protein
MTPGADPTVVSGSLAERIPDALVLRWACAGTVGVLLVLLAVYGVYLVRSILVLVFIALFLAVSLEPAVYWLTKLLADLPGYYQRLSADSSVIRVDLCAPGAGLHPRLIGPPAEVVPHRPRHRRPPSPATPSAT